MYQTTPTPLILLSPLNLINVNDVQFVLSVCVSLMPSAALAVESEKDLTKERQVL